MLKYLIALISVLGLALPARADESLDNTFYKVANEEKVPVALLRAICWAESKHILEAYNHGDGVGTNHAFGICQVLHSTAKEKGFKDDNCTKDFQDKIDIRGKVTRANKTYKDCKLFGAETNIRYGAKFLREKLTQYDDSWISAIAAYNAGSVRICKTGFVTRAKDKSILWKCKKGGVLNQKYVDDVLKALQENR